MDQLDKVAKPATTVVYSMYSVCISFTVTKSVYSNYSTVPFETVMFHRAELTQKK